MILQHFRRTATVSAAQERDETGSSVAPAGLGAIPSDGCHVRRSRGSTGPSALGIGDPPRCPPIASIGMASSVLTVGTRVIGDGNSRERVSCCPVCTGMSWMACRWLRCRHGDISARNVGEQVAHQTGVATLNWCRSTSPHGQLCPKQPSSAGLFRAEVADCVGNKRQLRTLVVMVHELVLGVQCITSAACS